MATRCDRCGAPTDHSSMTTLRPMYRVGGIKEVCPKCERELNKELDRLRDIAIRWWTMRLKAFIAGRKLARRFFWRGPKRRSALDTMF